MIFKILLLQLIVAVGVVFVLKLLLERELLVYAFEHITKVQVPPGRTSGEIDILVARPLSAQQESHLKALLSEKFPEAGCSILVNGDIGGGMVVRMAGEVWDFSLTGRLKILFGRGDA